MQIIIGKTAGFCFGVKNAVTKTEEELEKNNTIYCLGELVHNNQVTEELTAKGVNFIDNIDDAQDSVIIRSHGVQKQMNFIDYGLMPFTINVLISSLRLSR